MSVTVTVSSPAPGIVSLTQGIGPAVAGEPTQVANGEIADFATMLREATGAPVAETEGQKPGKALGLADGKKAKKDTVNGEGDDPAAVVRPETLSVATVSTASPANAVVTPSAPPPPPTGGSAADEDSVPVSTARKASATPRPDGKAMASAASEIADNIPAAVAPAEPEALTEPVTDAAQAQPVIGKKRQDASPDTVSEPKGRSETVGTADAVQATKAPAASSPSGEIGRTAQQAASQPPADRASPRAEPTPARNSRPREEGDAGGASPKRHIGEAAPQPVRAGEATALLAMARRADRRVARAMVDGAPLPPVTEGRPEFPAKAAGATQASPAAIAAVQAGPAAVRMSGSPANVTPDQPDRRADGATEDRSVTPTARGDGAATTGATAAPPSPLTPQPSVAAAGSTPGALSGALDRQVVDMGVSGQWIDDIARQIATVAANPGHGSFRIASEALGAVRVDLTPGKDGSDVLMTVDSDAARAALTKETDRLMQDARLASVRLGEVRVERSVPSADAPRSDPSQQQGGGQGVPAHAQAAMGQGSGQTDQHSARHDASAAMNQQQGGNSPKTPFIKSVLHDSGTAEQSAQDRGRAPDRARYA